MMTTKTKASIVFYFQLLAFHVIDASPNFVIFLADDLGYGDVGCFGNDTIRTPNIDSLAKNGMKLNHHLAAASVCTPSRAALLTGRYPIRSGMESSNRNKVFFFVAATGGLPHNETTFATALKRKGYSTAMIGKWHMGNDCTTKGDACHHPLNHGFDYFYGLPLSNFKDFGDDNESVITTYDPNFYSYIVAVIVCAITFACYLIPKRKILAVVILIAMCAMPMVVTLFLLNLKTINGIILRNTDVVEQPIRLSGLTQQFVKEAKAFLNKHSATEPFLLYMPFVHVHTSLFTSGEFSGSKHGRYGNNVEELDWAVGEVMGRLKSLGLMNNTFVYFSSDNGGHVEEYGSNGEREGGHNGIFRGGKTMAGMEGGIRVPSIVVWEGQISKSTETNITTSQMDLFPSIMELAGIPLPPDRMIDGKSIVPILKARSALSPHEFLFHYCGIKIHAATYVSGEKVLKIHWTTPKFLPGTNRCGYVCHCFGEFVVHHDPPLLYDLSVDPSESKTLNVTSNPVYVRLVERAHKARELHEATVDAVPDQFSFMNTIWKPWLQPCCNFPYCQCVDPLRSV